MKNKRICGIVILINILLPLAAGAAVYWILNPHTYIGEFLSRLFPFQVLGCLPEITGGKAGTFIKNYAADMTWAYAFAFSICLVTKSEKKTQRLCLGICMIVELILELAQYMHVISGYFDIMDLVLEGAVNVCAYLVWNYKVKQLMDKTFSREETKNEEQNCWEIVDCTGFCRIYRDGPWKRKQRQGQW